MLKANTGHVNKMVKNLIKSMNQVPVDSLIRIICSDENWKGKVPYFGISCSGEILFHQSKLAASFVLFQGSDRSPGRQARGRPARNPRGVGAGNVERQGQTGGRGGV